MTTDAGDVIEADFAQPSLLRPATAPDRYRETLRVIDRCLDLLERLIDEGARK